MLKQFIITGVAAAGLMLTAQSSAHQSHNAPRIHHGHGHSHHQPAPRPPKFRVNKEQREQAMMIKQGVKTCQITPHEAQKLYAQQNRIKKAEKRMRRDGLQRWERNKLKARLKKARVRINRFTQNADNCRPIRWRHSDGHREHNNHGHNNHGHSTWSHTSGNGSFSITIGH